jgi:hypothetical protein
MSDRDGAVQREFAERRRKGQLFNAYETSDPERFIVGLGPVSDCMRIAIVFDVGVADLITDALRRATKQPDRLSSLAQDITP